MLAREDEELQRNQICTREDEKHTEILNATKRMKNYRNIKCNREDEELHKFQICTREDEELQKYQM